MASKRKRSAPAHLSEYITESKRHKPSAPATPASTTTSKKRKRATEEKAVISNKRQKSAKKELTPEQKAAKRAAALAKERRDGKWTQDGHSFKPPKFAAIANSGPKTIPKSKEDFTDMDAFQLFAAPFVSHLVDKMNGNRTPHGIIEYPATTKSEVERFWACIIALSFAVYSSVDDAWSKNTSFWGSPLVQQLMPKNRFHELLSMLRLDILQISETLNAKFSQHWRGTSTQTIDDGHPCWSGRSYLVTHKGCKKKPFGLDVYMRNDENKFCCQFVPRYGEEYLEKLLNISNTVMIGTSTTFIPNCPNCWPYFLRCLSNTIQLEYAI